MSELEKKVERLLGGIGFHEPEIDVQTTWGSIFATVVSDSFRDMDEAERQRQVWTALREGLRENEQVAVEFVMTLSPDEDKEPE